MAATTSSAETPAKENTTAPTAIIGLGAMGLGLAKNMLRHGIALTGYDIRDEACDDFAAAGGRAAGSAAEAAADAGLLIIMVVNAAQVREVLFSAGEQSALAAMRDGGTVMLCSTIAPADTRAIAAETQAAGALLLDAPVSGGQAGAAAGTLTVMASGPRAAFDAAESALQAISKTVHRLGDAPGIGSTYKTVHQLATGAHLVVAAELLAFGARAGCDPRKLFDIVSTSAGQSWMFDDRAPRILNGDYAPRSTVDIFVKDLELALREGRDLSMPLPVGAAAHQVLLAASAMGCGGLDDAAVVKVYERITGALVRPEHGGDDRGKKV